MFGATLLNITESSLINGWWHLGFTYNPMSDNPGLQL